MDRTMFFVISLLFALTVASPNPNSSLPWQDTKHIIAFGDSYTYVQGTHGRQNASFIGDAQNFSFNASTLLSDRIVQNQTATAEGGPNWLEFLTGCGVERGLTAPKDCDRQLWDFAFGGADISAEFAETPLHHNDTVSFVKQIEQFRLYGDPVLENFTDKSNTLAAVWIGINDINDSANRELDFPGFYDRLIARMLKAVGEVYELRYGNFLFMNLPPLDRSPGNLVRAGNGDDPRPNRTMINWWNEALERQVMDIGKTHNNTNVKVFDANGLLNGVIDEPEKYGIRNVTGYCPAYNQPHINEDPESYGCLSLDEYFWFNSGHLTSHVHKIIASAVKRFSLRRRLVPEDLVPSPSLLTGLIAALILQPSIAIALLPLILIQADMTTRLAPHVERYNYAQL